MFSFQNISSNRERDNYRNWNRLINSSIIHCSLYIITNRFHRREIDFIMNFFINFELGFKSYFPKTCVSSQRCVLLLGFYYLGFQTPHSLTMIDNTYLRKFRSLQKIQLMHQILRLYRNILPDSTKDHPAAAVKVVSVEGDVNPWMAAVASEAAIFGKPHWIPRWADHPPAVECWEVALFTMV